VARSLRVTVEGDLARMSADAEITVHREVLARTGNMQTFIGLRRPRLTRVRSGTTARSREEKLAGRCRLAALIDSGTTCIRRVLENAGCVQHTASPRLRQVLGTASCA
jgi:hypothetical protein